MKKICILLIAKQIKIARNFNNIWSSEIILNYILICENIDWIAGADGRYATCDLQLRILDTCGYLTCCRDVGALVDTASARGRPDTSHQRAEDGERVSG